MDVDFTHLLPERLRDVVHVNRGTRSIHVEHRSKGAPLFRSWIADAQLQTFEIEPTDLDEIVRLKKVHVNEAVVAPEDNQSVKASVIEMIRDAALLRASDMHILRRQDFTEVQVRVHSELMVMSRMTVPEGDAFIRALYQGVANNRDTNYNAMEFQNAQISGPALHGTGLTSVRIVRGPAHPVEDGGSFAVLRLQYSDVHAAPILKRKLRTLERPRKPDGEILLARMGFSESQVERLVNLSNAPSGALILTGPTGSGKTTTIYELSADLARRAPGRRQITIEEPVEYPMPWAVQLNVSNASGAEASGDAFGERLRVGLRMDPDAILIGEIRDAHVALSMINAALTGHWVTTTMHVTDPFMFVERLEFLDRDRLHRGMFCDPSLICGVVAQRLIPLLCKGCAVPLRESLALPRLMDAAMRTYGDPAHVHSRGAGCVQCLGSGTMGRRGIAEVVVTDEQIMLDFVEKGTAIARHNYRARPEADPTILQAAMTMVLAGEVDLFDVTKFVAPITANVVYKR